MNTRAEILLWAQRVVARKAAPAHEILELKADSTPQQAQEAFHKIARTAHPDLHRKGLKPDELEMVTSAYAISAGAYQTMRTQTMQTTRMRPIEAPDTAERSGQTPPAGTPTASRPVPTRPPASAPTRPTPVPTRPTPIPPGVTPPPSPPITPAGPAPGTNAAQAMSSKALIYYRKAELCLKRGDLKGAVLQIKLAIAADPVSAFLRTALAEVELEVRKGT